MSSLFIRYHGGWRDVILMGASHTLRREISARNILRGSTHISETTYGSVPHVIYQESECGEHGNFLPASYRRICASPEWKRRLDKAYTSSSRLARGWERRRGELECANSSDALLMNIFCYPRLPARPAVRALMGTGDGVRPEFGVRAELPMLRGEVDRTEVDMRVGSLLVEAKLTETGFGTARRGRLMRYLDVDAVFDVEALPWSGDLVHGYQLIRGVLAAREAPGSFALLCDRRRADLTEMWFRVLCAVRSSEVRSRMSLLYWQELAGACPVSVRKFLVDKYGIAADGPRT